MVDQRARHRAYVREHGEDLPEVKDWQWSAAAGPSTEGGNPLREPEA
jgi:xylulose-5-phosphate/fructose-6-phosphate phosphoketolase